MPPFLAETSTDLQLIVSAAAVPMTIVDYTAVIDRYAGRTEREVRSLLSNGDELLASLRLPRTLASSPEWLDLYGSPLSAEAPDLPARHFTPDRYPILAQSMIDQLAHPSRGSDPSSANTWHRPSPVTWWCVPTGRPRHPTGGRRTAGSS